MSVAQRLIADDGVGTSHTSTVGDAAGLLVPVVAGRLTSGGKKKKCGLPCRAPSDMSAEDPTGLSGAVGDLSPVEQTVAARSNRRLDARTHTERETAPRREGLLFIV